MEAHGDAGDFSSKVMAKIRSKVKLMQQPSLQVQQGQQRNWTETDTRLERRLLRHTKICFVYIYFCISVSNLLSHVKTQTLVKKTTNCSREVA